MGQRIQPAAPTIARSLTPPDPADNAATGTTMDTLEQTSRSITPDTKTGTHTTAQPRSKIIIQAGPLIEAKNERRVFRLVRA